MQSHAEPHESRAGTSKLGNWADGGLARYPPREVRGRGLEIWAFSSGGILSLLWCQEASPEGSTAYSIDRTRRSPYLWPRFKQYVAPSPDQKSTRLNSSH